MELSFFLNSVERRTRRLQNVSLSELDAHGTLPQNVFVRARCTMCREEGLAIGWEAPAGSDPVWRR